MEVTVNGFDSGKEFRLVDSNSKQKVNQLNYLGQKASLPIIFNLNIDCFHEIFEWLSQYDIISIGKTCRRLRRIAADYFQLNYRAKCGRAERTGIYISSIRVNIFSEYLQKISISGELLRSNEFIEENCISIKHFRVYGFLPEGGFGCIQQILKGVEVLEINECFVVGEFYNNCLKYCPKLKTLSVSRSSFMQKKKIIIGTGNDWLFRKYPTLEHIDLTDLYEIKKGRLKKFFQQNANIKTFSTDAKTLWLNQNTLLQLDLKLEKFAVYISQSKVFNTKNLPIAIKVPMYELLDELYARCFYKRLHLYVFLFDQENLDKMISLSGIEMLSGDIHRIDRTLVDLRSFSVCYGDEIMNIENLPKNLPNLDRIYFTYLTSTHILPFICYSPHLRIIKIRNLIEGVHFKNGILDVTALNEERKKLDWACKTTIYIDEEVYLTSKWAHYSINLNFIELKRFESIEWDDLNGRSRYFKSF